MYQNVSEVCKVISVGRVGKAVVVLLLEVLIRAELAEKREEHMQGLNRRLIILQLVHWNVTHRANDLGVVRDMHVDLGPREGSLFEGSFHLGVPFLH